VTRNSQGPRRRDPGSHHYCDAATGVHGAENRLDPLLARTDPHGSYFGAELGERTLLPETDATLGEVRCRDWPGRTAGK
jgi:hypothetical protein